MALLKQETLPAKAARELSHMDRTRWQTVFWLPIKKSGNEIVVTGRGYFKCSLEEESRNTYDKHPLFLQAVPFVGVHTHYSIGKFGGRSCNITSSYK